MLIGNQSCCATWAITSAVNMAHFSRGSFSLFPVILLIVSLLPFCHSRSVVASRQLSGTVTMADVNFSCPAGGKWYVLASKIIRKPLTNAGTPVHRVPTQNLWDAARPTLIHVRLVALQGPSSRPTTMDRTMGSSLTRPVARPACSSPAA